MPLCAVLLLWPWPARSLEVLGIHSSPAPAIPLFLVYLATLMHTYSLATRHAAAAAAAAVAAEGNGDGVGSGGGPGGKGGSGGSAAFSVVVVGGEEEGGAPSPVLGRRRRAQHLGDTVSSAVTGWLHRIGAALVDAGSALWEFLLRACAVSERPPHYLLVRLRWRQEDRLQQGAQQELAAAAGWPGAGEGEGGEEEEGEEARGRLLQRQLQHVLDSYRRTDITAARERQDLRVSISFSSCLSLFFCLLALCCSR